MQTFVWIYFVLFAIVILVVLWLGQYVFLYNYYRSAKVSNISREANRIIQAYGTEEQGHINRTVAYENSMCIVITDTDGNPLTSENNLGSYSKLYDDIEHNYSMYIFELKSALEKEKDNCYTVTFDNDDLNVKEMIYCAKVYTDDSEDQAYLFIESTIEPIDSTVKIIREQLMFISIILFELAIIVGTLAAMRLSRPIISITKTAKRFGEGDFADVVHRYANPYQGGPGTGPVFLPAGEKGEEQKPHREYMLQSHKLFRYSFNSAHRYQGPDTAGMGSTASSPLMTIFTRTSPFLLRTNSR